jgi:hypothetical protein
MALTRCPDCGTEVSDQAAACPKCGRPLRAPAPIPPQQATAPKKKTSRATWGCLILIILAVIGTYLTSKVAPSGGFQASAPSAPKDDLDVFKARYGQPDVEDSTENESPRPPIVTRWIIYKKEHVRATYVPGNGHVGDPPPYTWKLIGFQDPRDNSVIRPAEVVNRMKARDSKPN